MSTPRVLYRHTTSSDETIVELREWPADADEGDLGIMYVLEVLGVSIIVRDRADGLYVHLDTCDAETVRAQPDLPLIVEVNNNGETHHGALG